MTESSMSEPGSGPEGPTGGLPSSEAPASTVGAGGAPDSPLVGLGAGATEALQPTGTTAASSAGRIRMGPPDKQVGGGGVITTGGMPDTQGKENTGAKESKTSPQGPEEQQVQKLYDPESSMQERAEAAHSLGLSKEQAREYILEGGKITGVEHDPNNLDQALHAVYGERPGEPIQPAPTLEDIPTTDVPEEAREGVDALKELMDVNKQLAEGKEVKPEKIEEVKGKVKKIDLEKLKKTGLKIVGISLIVLILIQLQTFSLHGGSK